MNYKMVGFVLGRIFLIEAALMLFPMGCAAIHGEWASIPAFLIPVVILLVLGLIGEYVGRIYMCANAAPQYVAREYIKHE